ncbi:MAG: cell wall-active antibiotics response protein [Chlorobi bacterium]|nr:cell wall-active antibiotics response protein [Chlorobiota bacterium]
MERMNETQNRFDKRIILALLLMLFGGLLLAGNFHIIPYNVKHYIFSWKMLLIVIGVISLASRQSVITGVILIAIGVFFMLPDIFYMPFNYHRLFWPVFLIGLGILLLFRRRRYDDNGYHPSSVYDHDYIDELNVFSGSERTITSQNFKGGKITSVFGGSSFDLLNAKLAPGTNVIDVFTLFGGSKIIVPANWEIKVDVISIFGGFSDKRRNVINVTDSDQRLVIKGIAIFGGGEIKSI